MMNQHPSTLALSDTAETDRPDYAFSLIIPLYRSESSLTTLVSRLQALPCSERWQVVFVDDGSPDQTYSTLCALLKHSSLNAILIRHTRNFGEHHAVLTGYRYALGEYFLNIDDDLQNPPEEGLRLLDHARQNQLDLVYGNYRKKRHEGWRNIGSKFANLTARFLLDLPSAFYLSSFRCVSRDIGRQVARSPGPFVYIDGIISQYTNNIDSLYVQHDPRHSGESNYNLRRLVRLWLVILTSFSLMPLRIASIVGIISALGGAVGLVYVFFDAVLHSQVQIGWSSVFSAILFFGGIQSLLLGVVGEYIGRIYLTVNGKPQSHVRSVQSFDPSHLP